MGCRRRQARQGFLLSTLLLGTPWTMNGEIMQNPNSGEARHATRQRSRYFFCSFIHSFNEYDRKVGVIHLCDDRIQKAANFELGQKSNRYSSLVVKW